MFSSISRRAGFWLSAVGIASQIAACGGGGASSDAPPRQTMSFSPSTVTATFQRGVTSHAETVATFNTPSDLSGGSFTLDFTDKNSVTNQGYLVQESPIRYKIIMYSNPAIAAGRYQSTFTIKICYDAACKNQFPGSPMELPYNILVTPEAAASGAPPVDLSDPANQQADAALNWRASVQPN